MTSESAATTTTSSVTEQSGRTFISVTQSVAFQRDFRFELFTTQITEVTSLCVVSVHMSLQVTPAAACIVTHIADVWLQTCSHGHTHTRTNTHLKRSPADQQRQKNRNTATKCRVKEYESVKKDKPAEKQSGAPAQMLLKVLVNEASLPKTHHCQISICFFIFDIMPCG